MRIEHKLGATVRLTLLTSCQSGCNFCHLEGFKTASEIGRLNPAIAAWKSSKQLDNPASRIDTLRTIEVAASLNLKNVNITGGEPTLHPELQAVISELNAAGLSVSITTHGELSPEKFARYLTPDLDWIVFSLHAIEPEDYLKMDLVAQEIAIKHSHADAMRFAAYRLSNKQANLLAALKAQQAGVIGGVMTNTVVMGVQQTRKIIEYCNALGLTPRIQRDLNDKAGSQLLVDSLIQSVSAECIGVQQAIGDSSGSGVDYFYTDPLTGSSHSFRLKDFGEVYVDAMCNHCELRGSLACREKFYGVRVEKGRVRTCIDLDIDTRTTFDPDIFIAQLRIPGSIPHAIAQQYTAAMDILGDTEEGNRK